MSTPQSPNLSSPRHRTVPPRELTAEEAADLTRIADLLIPGTDTDPAPSSADGFQDALRLALAARSDAFELLLAFALTLRDRGDAEALVRLRAAHEAESPAFQALSTVVAGAYLLLPQIRRNIGYPGQPRDVPRVDEAADQIGDGILDPILERGPIYVEIKSSL
jgi:hypothetical protein